MRNILISFLLFLCLTSLSQRERGLLVEIKGYDLMKGLNGTQWELKKVLEKRRLFKVKRKVSKMEELHLSFKDGKVKYFYPNANMGFICDYKPVSDNEDDFMYLNSYCEQCNYYWTVYKLSDKKLILSMSVDLKKNNHQQKIGYLIFYKKID